MTEVRLSLLEHLEELRRRIIVSILAVIGGGIVTYLWVEEVGEILSTPAENLSFVYLAPPELFLVYVRLSVIGGIVLASPIILIQIWLFLLPALTKKEKAYVFFTIFFGALLFAGGGTFAFYTILPLSINFFVNYANPDIVPMFSFANYIGFVTSIMLAFGIAFELPIVVIALTKIGLITPKTLGKFRKFALLIILALSSVLTPPDIISQLLLTGPMYLLFEISVFLARFFENKESEESSEMVT